MTGTDLKAIVSEELADLTPMPSVVPAVLADGRRRERRRRRVGVALAAAAVVGIVAVTTTTLGGEGPTSQHPPVADGPVTQTKAEFAEWSAGKFDEFLPDEFSDVRTTEHNDYVTYLGGTRVSFNLNISYVAWTHSDYEPGEIDLSPTCDGVDGDSCTERPGLDAIANHDTFERDGGSYASMEMFVGDRSDAADSVALNFFGEPGEGPVPLTDNEILDLAASPKFESIWREYTAHPKWISSATLAKLEPMKRDRGSAR